MEDEITTDAEMWAGLVLLYLFGVVLSIIVTKHVHTALMWPITGLRCLWDGLFGGVTW